MRGSLAILIGLTFAGLAAAQAPIPSALVKFKEADKLFQSGELLKAAPLFHELTLDIRAPNRNSSFDRLIAIYMRLGRCDQAIQTGERYLALLKDAGDARTGRIVGVQM